MDPVLNKDFNHFAVWMTLKFLMNIFPTHLKLGNKSILLYSCRVILNIRELKERVETNFPYLSLSVSTYNRIINFFESEKRITREAYNVGTVITLLYYCGKNPKFPTLAPNKKRVPTNDFPQGDSGHLYKDLDNYIHTTQKEGFIHCEVAENGITNRKPRKTIELEDYYFNSPNSFRSIYDYPESFLEHFTSIQSVSGYSGLRYGNWLIFDIDRLKQPDRGLKDVINFIERLHAIYGVDYDQILVYFSGHKGFHVYLNVEQFGGWEPSENLYLLHRKLAEKIAIETSTVIDMQIYDNNRLIRIQNTMHSESGLYKVEIPMRMILQANIEQILERAKAPCESEFPFEYFVNDSLRALWQEVLNDFQENSKHTNQPQSNFMKSWIDKPCVERLLKGVRLGGRHNAAMRIADYLRKRGDDQETVLEVLSCWSEKCRPPYNLGKDVLDLEKIASDVFIRDYDYGCNDILLADNCNKDCPIYPRQTKTE